MGNIRGLGGLEGGGGVCRGRVSGPRRGMWIEGIGEFAHERVPSQINTKATRHFTFSSTAMDPEVERLMMQQARGGQQRPDATTPDKCISIPTVFCFF